MTNRASVLWKILKGLAKKWPEMVVQWSIVTTRLGETVFSVHENCHLNSNTTYCAKVGEKVAKAMMKHMYLKLAAKRHDEQNR